MKVSESVFDGKPVLRLSAENKAESELLERYIVFRVWENVSGSCDHGFVEWVDLMPVLNPLGGKSR